MRLKHGKRALKAKQILSRSSFLYRMKLSPIDSSELLWMSKTPYAPLPELSDMVPGYFYGLIGKIEVGVFCVVVTGGCFRLSGRHGRAGENEYRTILCILGLLGLRFCFSKPIRSLKTEMILIFVLRLSRLVLLLPPPPGALPYLPPSIFPHLFASMFLG